MTGHAKVSTMKIGFDAEAGPGGVKCEGSSSSTAESNSEDESLKLFMETDAKYSLPLIFINEYELLTRTRVGDQDRELTGQ